jgi:hypothetical protein
MPHALATIAPEVRRPKPGSTGRVPEPGDPHPNRAPGTISMKRALVHASLEWPRPQRRRSGAWGWSDGRADRTWASFDSDQRTRGLTPSASRIRSNGPITAQENS